jgi:hypothetical protein
MTISDKRDNTSRQAKACLRNRARIVDVYNQQRRAAKKKHKRVMSKDEVRERLTCDLQIADNARDPF